MKVAVCPEVRVTGVEIPVKVNPVPVIVTPVIVTLEPPVFLRVSDKEELLPKTTVPKARLLGFGPRPPGVAPVPASAMVSEGLEAFEVRVTEPVAFPADCGVKVTVRVVL